MCFQGAMGMASGIGQSVGSQSGTAMNAEMARKQYNYLEGQAGAQMGINRAAAQKSQELVMDQAAIDSALLGKKVGKLYGEQKAQFAAQGIGGGSVTIADIIRDTHMQSELDKVMIKYNASLKNYGIENELQNDIYNLKIQEGQYNSAAKNVMKAAKASAMIAVFTGGSGGGQIAQGASGLLGSAKTTKDYTNTGKEYSYDYTKKSDREYGYTVSDRYEYENRGTVPSYLSIR